MRYYVRLCGALAFGWGLACWSLYSQDSLREPALTTGSKGPVEQTPGVTPKVGATDIESAMTTMSPSMQRRMLRFVNRAYRPEDLMKSPQEVRTKSEHMPLNAHKNKSDATTG